MATATGCTFISSIDDNEPYYYALQQLINYEYAVFIDTSSDISF